MKVFMLALAALTAFAFPAQAAAPARKTTPLEKYGTTSKWVLFRSFKDDMCAAVTVFSDDAKLSLHWEPRSETMTVFYETPILQSLKSGREYIVGVSFVKGEELDGKWGEVTATASRTEDGVPQFFFKLPGKDALADIAASNLMGITYKDKIVASLSLKDSAVMVQQLRRCSTQIIANHPIDPFEE